MATFEKGRLFLFTFLYTIYRYFSLFYTYNYVKLLIYFFLRLLVWFEMLSRPEARVNMLITV